ncbi:hypothetical protein BJY18_007134 [Amycolatopsis jiangsuensis]|uniref:FAD-dependent oxidoreductase 2 FAD-binding domain-containing protein n=1 Tax=Amycolatopsis jiangsuensis TaxID=1181879 RepID=A0A840J7F8_9PSEU|nr:hypothetical protein [Amycolatopsis jiangsuensis]
MRTPVRRVAVARHPRALRHARHRLVTGPGGGVDGLRANGPDGPQTLWANRAVVLASGGFTNDSEMARNYLRLPWGSPGNTGDGIRIGQKVCDDLAHPDNYMTMPGIRIPPCETGEYAQPQDSRFIYVGADGRRFCDDSVESRHGKTAQRGSFDFFPGFPMWTIFDEDGRAAGPLV